MKTGAVHTSIDAYIADAEAEVQPILERIREVVRAVAPDAVERISYRMPAFWQNGDVIYFAAFKSHIGIFPPVRGDEKLAAALEPYRGPKGNLRFPLDEKMPYPLIRRVAKTLLAEHLERLAKKPKRRK